MLTKENLLYDSIRPVTWKDNGVLLLDQRRLPDEEVYHHINNTQALYEAIRDMAVRGAPAIGIAAAFGAVLASQEADDSDFDSTFNKKLDLLASTRPTAINLSNALNAAKHVNNPKENLLSWAHKWLEDDISANKIMGQLGGELIKQGSTVITHCNAGALATGGYGTALGVIRWAHQHNLIKRIYFGETRPWNQGARLTRWEFEHENIPANLLIDSAMASTMLQSHVDWLIVGADSICLNGDIANKIGTYSLAVLAKHHGVKVMTVAPTTTIDLSAEHGDNIEIEQRGAHEVLSKPYAKETINVLNPSFDITPASLISAIVTEKGVIESPNTRKMQTFMASINT